ncbi:hypothetical protein Tco_1169689, partial [Tanacetum coccineum]
MYSPAHTVPKIFTPIDRARDSPVITPFHDDPYVLVRQAYTPIATDIESEPFEDPIETKKTQPLSPRAAPLSHDYTPTSPDYTHNTPRSDKDLEPIEASEIRTASPSGSTSPLSPDHPLTQTSPTSTPSRAFYYRSTTHMTRYRSSYKTPSSSASPASSPTFPIRKRYQGTSEPILDTKAEGNDSKAKGTGSESEESEDEGPDSESEEVTSKEQQQRTVPVEDTVEDEPLGLGYGAARRHALELAEDITHNTYEVGQSSRYVPVQQTSEETTTSRLPVLTTWEDPMDASLTVPSPLASPVTTSAATITVDEGKFLEVGAQLKLHVLHDHTLRLDALPPTLFEGYGRDFTRLFARLEVVRDEIHSHRFRLGSLERAQEQDTITLVPYGDQFWPSRQ